MCKFKNLSRKSLEAFCERNLSMAMQMMLAAFLGSIPCVHLEPGPFNASKNAEKCSRA